MQTLKSPLELDCFTKPETFTHGINIDNTNKKDIPYTPQAFSNTKLSVYQEAKRNPIDKFTLPEGELVYAFYESVDSEIIRVTTDSIQEMVDTLNEILGLNIITPQRILRANTPTTLYGKPYISNIVTYYTDKENHIGYRFVIVYKSIWDSYSNTQRKNRLNKL